MSLHNKTTQIYPLVSQLGLADRVPALFVVSSAEDTPAIIIVELYPKYFLVYKCFKRVKILTQAVEIYIFSKTSPKILGHPIFHFLPVSQSKNFLEQKYFKRAEILTQVLEYIY